ncbi:Hypothetical predicted protein [Scomber scombrus]|uniref:Uncharacterized protein n=1 Tax=Scomber scombrus TaxID=13677 RepID=A0AAV1P484_SCOSC
MICSRSSQQQADTVIPDVSSCGLPSKTVKITTTTSGLDEDLIDVQYNSHTETWQQPRTPRSCAQCQCFLEI